MSTNRLKNVLPKIVIEHQFAFTKDCLISGNILIAFKTLHCIKNYDSRFMALKLDMSKAYNWVEWSFRENLMRKMGFSERWIGLIMICVKKVSYSILINGEPKGLINPTRGIKQGDPLYHFLFFNLY